MPDDQTTVKDLPWHWPEEKWRGIVNKVRAGRSLKPKSWPGGAKVGVALSFDSDHETSTLRFGESSPGKLSQGEYGSRVGVRRIRECLARHDIKASFFVPAVVAELHPDEQKPLSTTGMRWHSWLDPRIQQRSDGDRRARHHDGRFRCVGTDHGKRPVGMRTPSWDFTPYTL